VLNVLVVRVTRAQLMPFESESCAQEPQIPIRNSVKIVETDSGIISVLLRAGQQVSIVLVPPMSILKLVKIVVGLAAISVASNTDAYFVILVIT